MKPLFDEIETAIHRLKGKLASLQLPNQTWEGRLASSALATATAVSALSILRDGPVDAQTGQRIRASSLPEVDRRQTPEYDELIDMGCRYIMSQQNQDGGWGDTDLSNSNISTTLLCIAAIRLASREQEFPSQLESAWRYVDALGRWDGLKKRYGKDKTFAVPILTNCALAGLIEWKHVPALPFEAAALPQSMYRFIRLPVVSYAIPALVAIGQVREHFYALKNPIRWPIRKLAIKPSLSVLRKMQPASGGYLEAVPLTSFVLMSLAAKGMDTNPVSVDAIKYLLSSVREDGSWPIDTNLATWVTSLATLACLNCDETVTAAPENLITHRTIDWLLSCQHRRQHPFTGAAPGGWGWSDLSGAVPDADDTPAALLALFRWVSSPVQQSPLAKESHADQPSLERNSTSKDEEQRHRIGDAVCMAIRWLLGLQNRDGGWPTFCRGWGALPFDRSGSDLTAHAMRALHVWHSAYQSGAFEWLKGSPKDDSLFRSIPSALARGWSYLEKHQNADGSWLPLWFGNQDEHDEINPVYGTARVLMAYSQCEKISSGPAQRAIRFLMGRQNKDHGWGGGDSVQYSTIEAPVSFQDQQISTVEETAQALEALIACGGTGPAIENGLRWLCNAIQQGKHEQPQPIGFYFAKLWYYEQMYPVVYSLAALGRASKGQRN